MIRHPEEQRIGERRMDIATSHRREQLRKDNRYRDRRSRSEQVPGSVAIKAGETLVRNSTIVGDRSGAEVETVHEQHIEPASPAGPSAVAELAGVAMSTETPRISAAQAAGESTEQKIARLEQELTALRADAALLDWMGSLGADTDITICPPGNHGGPADKWLVSIDNDTPRCRPLIEAYGDTPRAALAAASAK